MSVDAIKEFQDAIAAAGLPAPHAVEDDGELHRYSTNGKASDRAGWYVLHTDGDIPAGAFGCWRADVNKTWCADLPPEMTEQQRQAHKQRMGKMRAQAKAERQQRNDKAATNARELWDRAGEADTLHGYLVAKNIEPYGIKQDGDNLLIPVYVDGELSSLQRIDTCGQKRFLSGGRIKGGYFIIGDPAEALTIAEGYGTAASIYEATRQAVCVAFNAGNLLSVAQTMRRKYPGARITIAADDDRNTEGNPGIAKATEAATAIHAALATPGQPGDFNDLMEAQGADAVRERLEQAQAIRPKGFRLVRAGTLEVREHDWLIDGMLERDSLAAYFGPPETWKSLYAIDMCCSIAHGVDFHGQKVKQGNVAYVCGEGFSGLARRFQAWCIRHGINPDDNRVMVSTQAAQLNDPETFPLVAATIADAKPDLVVIDTLARNFGPGDENATSDMVRFIAACDRIRAENGCTVALVHHSGLMDRTRGRGNSALKGALDWEYMFTRTGDVVEVECTKVKDAERPMPQAFALDVVTLGTGVNSVTIRATEPPKAAPNTRKGKHQLKALSILESLTDLHRENLTAGGCDPETARVSLNDWRDTCVKEKMPRNRWYEVKQTLESAKEIVITPGGFVQLSGCPVPLRETGQNRTGQSDKNRTKPDLTGQQTGH